MPQEKLTAKELVLMKQFTKNSALNGISKLQVTFTKNKVSISCKKKGSYYGGSGRSLKEAIPFLEKRLLTR